MVEEIYLIRHGLTDSNKKKIYAGWNGESLSAEGIMAIRDVSKRLLKFHIEKIYSSPIRRAIQTAEIIGSTLKVGVVIEGYLKEMQMGPWEGLSENEVAEIYPNEWKIWNTKPSDLRIERREILRDLLLRSLIGINRISGLSNCSRILAVTHIAIIRMLMVYHNGLYLDDYRKIEAPNGAVFVINSNKPSKKMIRVF